jgi:ADP-ribose pyrophosphatase YjhB (NUDIX family)
LTGRARRLAAVVPTYVRLAWWGLAAPRTSERGLLRVVQAVVRSEAGILLAVRSDLRGWELPGGNPRPGESEEDALRREVCEETGLEVVVERRVGDYVRSGFRPHVARVYACRVRSGRLAPSSETPRLRWFDPRALPTTLFPWYRAPVADALAACGEPVMRREHQGVRAVLAGMWIDLRMRWSADRAG